MPGELWVSYHVKSGWLVDTYSDLIINHAYNRIHSVHYYLLTLKAVNNKLSRCYDALIYMYMYF